MSDYKLTVGLEIHAELNTRTKMFCDSKNDTSETRPNVNICPICMGHPGTLPTINREAVRSVLRLGTAVGGEIADYTEFDRKNYFYPDIPKGYQISQYKYPLVRGGSILGIPLTRIHLEEDTAKSTHDKGEDSLVDFNRAGVPLVELVTEPAIHDAESAANFAKEFQLILQYLDIAEANMEKGEMRVEANISLHKKSFFGGGKLGTKVEVKNLNSFKSVEKAIKYEVVRQQALLERGEKVVQETRGWDENKEETFSQREKESSHDYRYFPDPDLPKLFIKDIPEFSVANLKATLPELPDDKRTKYRILGIKEDDIDTYVNNREKGEYLESVTKLLEDKSLASIASNYILSDVKGKLAASNLVGVIEMLNENLISSRGAKDLIATMPEAETDIRKFAENNNLLQISDREILKQYLAEAQKENPKAPAQYLVGEAMKKSKGRANPQILQELVLEMLDQ